MTTSQRLAQYVQPNLHEAWTAPSKAAEPNACAEPGSTWVQLTADAAQNHEISRALLERLQAELTPHPISDRTSPARVGLIAVDPIRTVWV